MFVEGQQVFVKSRYGKRLSRVEKITPKGLVKVNGTYYYNDGSERGGDIWNRTHIYEATQEDIDEFRKEIFTSKCIDKMRSCTELTYEQAQQINIIMGWGNDRESTASNRRTI